MEPKVIRKFRKRKRVIEAEVVEEDFSEAMDFNFKLIQGILNDCFGEQHRRVGRQHYIE